MLHIFCHWVASSLDFSQCHDLILTVEIEPSTKEYLLCFSVKLGVSVQALDNDSSCSRILILSTLVYSVQLTSNGKGILYLREIGIYNLKSVCLTAAVIQMSFRIASQCFFIILPSVIQLCLQISMIHSVTDLRYGKLYKCVPVCVLSKFQYGQLTFTGEVQWQKKVHST